MEETLKIVRTASVVTAVVSYAAVAFWLWSDGTVPIYQLIFPPLLYVYPPLLGYFLTRRDSAGIGSIGFAVVVIFFYWMVLFTDWEHESGDGIVLIFTVPASIFFGLIGAVFLWVVARCLQYSKRS